MQDKNGKALAVGDKVAFSKWDESDKGKSPIEIPAEGVVVALENPDKWDERAGDVVVKSGDETLTFSTGAVAKIEPETEEK